MGRRKRAIDAFDMALGAYLRELRLTRGMTLIETSTKAGLSHSFLSQIEHGHARPSFDSLNLIAKALGVSRAEITAGAAVVRDSGPRDAAEVGTPEAAEEDPTWRTEVLHQTGSPFSVLRVAGFKPADGGIFSHPEPELFYVLKGKVELILDGEARLLSAGGSATYRGGQEHTWRAYDEKGFEALAVKLNPLGIG